MYQWLFHTTVGITGRKTRKYFLLTRQIPRMSQVVLLCCRNSQCGSVLPGKGRMGRCTAARAYSIRRLQVQNAFKSINQKLSHLLQFLQCMFIHSWPSHLHPISRNHFLMLHLLQHKHTDNSEYFQPEAVVPLKIRSALLGPLCIAFKVFINQ